MATAKDYRDKTEAELNIELLDLRKEQFNLRMQRGAGQMSKPHLFQVARKDIARLKTILSEKTRNNKATAGKV